MTSPVALPTVGDRRTGYFHPAREGQPVSETPSNARNYRNVNGNVQVSSGPGVLTGLRVRAGAAEVIAIVYDATDDGGMTGENVKEHTRTSVWDGVADTPIVVERGIRVSISGADANTDVTVYYR